MATAQYFPSMLTAAKAGAPWAWCALYERHAGPMAAYLDSLGAPSINEIVQATFLEAVDRVHAFEGGEPGFRAWLFAIAHRRLREEWARRGAPVVETDLADMARLADAAWLTADDAPMRQASAFEVKASLRGCAFGSPADRIALSERSLMASAAGVLARATGQPVPVHAPVLLPDAGARAQAF